VRVSRRFVLDLSGRTVPIREFLVVLGFSQSALCHFSAVRIAQARDLGADFLYAPLKCPSRLVNPQQI
jgi:hypothetical protein